MSNRHEFLVNNFDVALHTYDCGAARPFFYVQIIGFEFEIIVTCEIYQSMSNELSSSSSNPFNKHFSVDEIATA